MSMRSGTCRVPWPGEGANGLAPWEYTLPKLLSDAGYATALYGKWHLGDTPGRLPSDMSFDEWWGIKNTWNEAGYTTYPLFKESGVEPPMIWEGRRGGPSKPVMPLDLNVRGIVDEKHLIPKTIDFIKRQAAAKKPFFVYLGYSEMHPPAVVNPNFDRTSPRRGGIYSDLLGDRFATTWKPSRVSVAVSTGRKNGRATEHRLHPCRQRRLGRLRLLRAA
jgi:arylsulfatase A-like enzyme